MSFTRFRKERSKPSSVQDKQDYIETVKQQDNLSQSSHPSRDQYQYQPKQPQAPLNKSQNIPRYNNDINNLPRSKGNSQNPSVSSSSSAAENQYICNNCINDALIYEKQLNARNNDRPINYVDDPMEMQDRLAQMERDRLNNQINQRMNMARQAAENLGGPSDKDKLIAQNEKADFFLNKSDKDPQIQKVLDKYNQIDKLNAKRGNLNNNQGVDDYYKNYVDNYKNNYDDYLENDPRRNMQEKYNQELKNQIEANKKLRDRDAFDNQRYKDDLKRKEDQFNKEQEDEAKRLRDRQNEVLQTNLNLIDAKRKKAENDRLLDAYDQQRNAAYLKKQMEDEQERLRKQKDAQQKGWQQALDNQINERNLRNKMERDLNRLPNQGKFDENEHEGCQCGKCCVCKRIYPLSVLNPRKKYASLARIEKMRRKRQEQKKVAVAEK